MRWVISSLEEFIAQNTDEEAKDFDHEHGIRIRQLRPAEI
jgi:hypothetical protein